MFQISNAECVHSANQLHFTAGQHSEEAGDIATLDEEDILIYSFQPTETTERYTVGISGGVGLVLSRIEIGRFKRTERNIFFVS